MCTVFILILVKVLVILLSVFLICLYSFYITFLVLVILPLQLKQGLL